MLTVVAMSGGVDSSVAAALCAKQRGAACVVGVALRLADTDERQERVGKTCCAPDDLYDARRAAAVLGIRFYVHDARETFRREVIDDFVQAYAEGKTPNPCVRCNDSVKFDWLLERARRLGADELVTGHYARVQQRKDGTFALLRAVDASKDQSYFLHGLSQEALKLVRFPLGGLKKTEVRALARARKLPNADKPESMEVCFVEGRDVGAFLEEHGVPKATGAMVDLDGKVLGAHAGVHHFTVGQRRGLGISHPLPLYVASLDAASQRVVLGTQEQATRREFEAEDARWTTCPLRDGDACEVQLRHRGKALSARVETHGQRVRVALDEPALGVAPGQSAVFYRGEEVLGGARIV